MKQKFIRFTELTREKKLFSLCMLLFFSSGLIILFSYRDGPASQGEHVTGAPFDSGQFCSKCHSGGNFGAAVTARLYRSDSTPVNAYIPNTTYYFVIFFRNTTGNPQNGFQTTSATTTAGTNVNGWRNIPAGTANRIVLGHNYVEHTAPFTLDTLVLPWRSPAAGTGSVTFYTAINLVNGNNRPTGDQPVRSTYTVAEATSSFAEVNTGIDKFASKIKTDTKHGLFVYRHGGYINMRFNNTGARQNALVQLMDMQGNLIYSGRMLMNEGNNIIPVSATNKKGILVASVTTEDGVRTTEKVILEQ